MSFSNPIFRRLAQGFGANLLGQVWIMLVQLITVPVLTHYWGVAGYGVWIMISAVPTYLSLSDFGLGVAAGVEITKALARGERDEALRVYHSAWAILTLLTGGAGVLIGGGALLWFALDGSAGGPFSGAEVAFAIVLTTLAAAVNIQTRFQRTIFDATHKYALGAVLFDLNFLLSGLVLLVVAWAGGGIVMASAAQIGVRGLLYTLNRILLRRLEPWWYPGWRRGDRATVRRLLHPSMASFGLAAANSFGLQGIVLTLGWSFGPAVAAVFATSRMLTRIPMQISTLLTRASLPELTRAQSTDDAALTRRLMRLNTWLVLGVMVPAAAIFALAGPWLLDKLSHGKMEAGHLPFLLFGLSATFCAIWTALGTRLIAINRQGVFAYLALGLYAAVAVLPFVPGVSYTAILVAMILAEVAIALRVATWRGEKG